MKVIIAGSRHIDDIELVEFAIKESRFDITEVVNGGCWGVDMTGVIWAKGVGALVKSFFPDWTRYGKSAGPIRNNQMAEYADALLAIWDGESKGTWDMIKRADKHELEIFVLTTT